MFYFLATVAVVAVLVWLWLRNSKQASAAVNAVVKTAETQAKADVQKAADAVKKV